MPLNWQADMCERKLRYAPGSHPLARRRGRAIRWAALQTRCGGRQVDVLSNPPPSADLRCSMMYERYAPRSATRFESLVCGRGSRRMVGADPPPTPHARTQAHATASQLTLYRPGRRAARGRSASRGCAWAGGGGRVGRTPTRKKPSSHALTRAAPRRPDRRSKYCSECPPKSAGGTP